MLIKTYKQSRTTKARHVMNCGDVVKIRQDLQDHSIWHLEIYKHGGQVNCMKLTLTADNCNSLFELLKSQQPKPEPKHPRKRSLENTRSWTPYNPSSAISYRKIKQW